MQRLILASGSPRRRDLMEEAGYEFEIIVSPAEEAHDPALKPWELTEANAQLKAEAIAERFADAVVIGADTLVYLDDEPLGKPRDMDDAENMLQRLVGRTHVVCTGVCLCLGGEAQCFHELTKVTFRNLDTDAIRKYLGMINPLDKAGAYAAQEHGEFIIEKTEGSWTNVVGLPMERLAQELKVIPWRR